MKQLTISIVINEKDAIASKIEIKGFGDMPIVQQTLMIIGILENLKQQQIRKLETKVSLTE